jgi:peptidase E
LPLIAWSAGAMACSERVVLFHDNPPQGAGNAEVLEGGLGLLPELVPLPHAHRRLQLDDQARIALFARRFAPHRCVALDDGAQLFWEQGRWSAPSGVRRLGFDGSVVEDAA